MELRRMITMFFVIFAVLAVPFLASGAMDQDERLLDILIKKGVITKEEAESLQKDVKKEGEAKGEWTDKIEVGYKNGAFIKTTDDRFSLKLNANFQGLFNYQGLEERENTSTFRVRRARLIPSGNAFFPWLKYYVQLTLEDSVNLRDAFLEADYYKSFIPKIGQYKLPFDREFITSAFNLQLIDRSIANTEFSLQRDVGFQVSGFPLKDLLEYRVGVFNGSGANRSNVNNEYMYVGRLVLTPFGPFPYSQAALDRPQKPLLAAGIAGAYLPDLDPGERRDLAGRLGNTQVVSVRSDVSQLTGDLAFKYMDFYFEGACHYRVIDPSGSTAFGEESATGYFVQAGYFLMPKHLEFAARYSYVNPDNPTRTSNDRQREITGGLSYYFVGHPLKVQANYSFLENQTVSGDQDSHLWQAQDSFMF